MSRIILGKSDAKTIALGSDFKTLPVGDELREYWLKRLPEGEGKILEVVARAYPDAVERETIGESTSYLRSSRDAYIHRLKARQLVTVTERGIKANENLFD